MCWGCMGFVSNWKLEGFKKGDKIRAIYAGDAGANASPIRIELDTRPPLAEQPSYGMHIYIQLEENPADKGPNDMIAVSYPPMYSEKKNAS